MRARLGVLTVLVLLLQIGCTMPERAVPPSAVEELADPVVTRDDVPRLAEEIRSMDDAEFVRFVEKIRATKPCDAEAALWQTVANSEAFSNTARRRAILQLFDRNFHPEMTVGDLTRVLGGPTWLDETKVRGVYKSTGHMPVDEVVPEQVFQIWPKLPPDDNAVVFLRFKDLHSEDAVCLALSGKDPATENQTISAMGMYLDDASDSKLVGRNRFYPDSFRASR
jgi:hypothetical protein